MRKIFVATRRIPRSGGGMLTQLCTRVCRWFSRDVGKNHERLSGPLARKRITTDVQIEHALRENGGRMRQQEIADRISRSEAAVSRNLTRMEADGRVCRFRYGREKIVCLPDVMPDSEAARTPESKAA